ncbi:MAG: excalibur calcium-binding domain-containing protein [Thermomonas sp.]
MHAHIAAHATWLLRAACVLIAFAGWESASAHGGGLDKNGCHTNRKTGDYHCHRAPSTQVPAKPPRAKTPATNLAPASGPKPKQHNERVFRNCSEARAAGAAPVRRGDPGYGAHLDRDNDGVGCE